MKIVFIEKNGVERDLDAVEGWTAMEILREHGVGAIKAECGGALACATCHGYVDPAWASRLPAPRVEEREMIEDHAMEPRETSRLSCQIVLTEEMDGLRLHAASNPE